MLKSWVIRESNTPCLRYVNKNIVVNTNKKIYFKYHNLSLHHSFHFLSTTFLIVLGLGSLYVNISPVLEIVWLEVGPLPDDGPLLGEWTLFECFLVEREVVLNFVWL